MKKTAKAPANIAFVKYWGKRDEELRLPTNDSLSMNLSDAYTTTTVEFSPQYKSDEVFFDGEKNDAVNSLRIIKHLDLIRKKGKGKSYAKVATRNSFPKASGIASSASGFAALTLAAVSALGLKLSEKELSVLARIGSGSACRSIPGGFVYWKSADDSENSYAYSLYSEKYWSLQDIVVILSDEEKAVSSSVGHENAQSSNFFEARLKKLPERIMNLKSALADKNFKAFGEIIETEAIEMHAIMMTQNPPLFYWNGRTLDLIHKVRQWRSEGIDVYFTIDAGPNVHLICEGKNEKKILSEVKNLKFAKNVIINTPAAGARLTEQHLF